MSLFILFILFYITSAAFNKPKICSNCKYYFIENKSDYPLNAKCLYFIENEKNGQITDRKKEIVYLVTGKTIEKIVDKRDLFFCSTARSFETMCGLEGKKFESKQNLWFGK